MGHEDPAPKVGLGQDIGKRGGMIDVETGALVSVCTRRDSLHHVFEARGLAWMVTTETRRARQGGDDGNEVCIESENCVEVAQDGGEASTVTYAQQQAK